MIVLRWIGNFDLLFYCTLSKPHMWHVVSCSKEDPHHGSAGCPSHPKIAGDREPERHRTFGTFWNYSKVTSYKYCSPPQARV